MLSDEVLFSEMIIRFSENEIIQILDLIVDKENRLAKGT